MERQERSDDGAGSSNEESGTLQGLSLMLPGNPPPAPETFAKQWRNVPEDIREALQNGGFDDPSTLAHAAEWDIEDDVRCMALQLELSEASTNLCVALLPALAIV